MNHYNHQSRIVKIGYERLLQSLPNKYGNFKDIAKEYIDIMSTNISRCEP